MGGEAFDEKGGTIVSSLPMLYNRVKRKRVFRIAGHETGSVKLLVRENTSAVHIITRGRGYSGPVVVIVRARVSSSELLTGLHKIWYWDSAVEVVEFEVFTAMDVFWVVAPPTFRTKAASLSSGLKGRGLGRGYLRFLLGAGMQPVQYVTRQTGDHRHNSTCLADLVMVHIGPVQVLLHLKINSNTLSSSLRFFRFVLIRLPRFPWSSDDEACLSSHSPNFFSCGLLSAM